MNSPIILSGCGSIFSGVWLIRSSIPLKLEDVYFLVILNPVFYRFPVLSWGVKDRNRRKRGVGDDLTQMDMYSLDNRML